MTQSDPEQLFAAGISAFNARDYYEAHEQWEDLWSDFRLPDADFVQGLIQFAVGCFHLTNQNLNGARSLFRKAQAKFTGYTGQQRGLDAASIKQALQAITDHAWEIDSPTQFDWRLVPIMTVTA